MSNKEKVDHVVKKEKRVVSLCDGEKSELSASFCFCIGLSKGWLWSCVHHT